MASKKEIFKLLIKEFHESSVPEVIRRDLVVPLNTSKVITVAGPRRAGKTFFFFQLVTNLLNSVPSSRILYMNYEDDRILPVHLRDLNELLESYFELYPENKEKDIYLFFDEIQNVEGWEVFVRRVHDREKARIFITGSSSKLLSQEIATSLRGRTLSYRIYPLSFREFLRFNDVEPAPDFAYSKMRFKIKKLIGEYITFGGFPEVALADQYLKFTILKNYYELAIYRDLVDRYSIRNILLLKNLMKYLITNVANLFSVNSYYRSIGQQLAVSRSTVIEYLGYLEEVGLISFAPFFSYSLKVQQVNLRKAYTVDTGLRNAVSFRFSHDEGRLAENVVFGELTRAGRDIFYWQAKNEVDFVVATNGRLSGLNVAYSDEPDPREVNGLVEFKREFGKKVEKLIVITKDLERTERKGKEEIVFVPLWKWLLLVDPSWSI